MARPELPGPLVDPIAAGGEQYKRGLPNVRVYGSHTRFGPTQADGRYLLRTDDGAEFTADKVVIAAGSRVRVPPAIADCGVKYHTSDDVMRIPELPEHLVIVGGGFVAAEFAHVFSAFGVQFAPRHAVVAAELLRVTRPGGAVVLANWTPEGQIGELFRIMGRYLPPPPAYASAPPLWGSEEHVRELFGRELEFERRTATWDFDSADEYVSFMETAYGPTLKARERLTADGTWDDCRRELVEMMERRNESTNGRLQVPAEYALIVVRA